MVTLNGHAEREERAGGARRRRETLRALVCASFVALLLPHAAGGLDPNTALTQYGHTAWRVRDGYFAGQPTAITQTRDGFLWIGTLNGLIRFDGVRFMPWEPPAGSRLPHDRIINLLAARDGSLWIGTANGLAQWRAPNLVVHARAGRFGALLEDRRGTIWAGHTRAPELPPLCRFERGEFRCFGFPDEPAPRHVGALHEDRQGNVWIGGRCGVCRWKPEPGRPECYTIGSPASEIGLGLPFRRGLWRHLVGGDRDLGIWRLVAGRWTRYATRRARNCQPGRSSRIGEAACGSGRMSTGSSGRKARTERITRADGLSGNAVNDLFEDREGSFWVATTAGLDRFRDVKVATLTPQEGLR